MSETQKSVIDAAAQPATGRGVRTRNAVREAAADCFAALGYDAATAAEIARRAGVSEATVFSYFGSKRGLLMAVMEDFYAGLLSETQRGAAAPADAAERFRRLVDTWASRVEQDWPLIQVFGQRARYGSDPELTQAFTELNRRFTRAHLEVLGELETQGRVAADLPLTLARDVLFGGLEHTALGQLAAGRPIALREPARRIVDLLVRSVPDAPPPKGDAGAVRAQLSRIERKLERLLDGPR